MFHAPLVSLLCFAPFNSPFHAQGTLLLTKKHIGIFGAGTSCPSPPIVLLNPHRPLPIHVPRTLALSSPAFKSQLLLLLVDTGRTAARGHQMYAVVAVTRIVGPFVVA